MKIRRWIIALFAVVMAVGFTGGSAMATAPKVKCNSGSGNGSEIIPPDCDPGNSGGHNNGGD